MTESREATRAFTAHREHEEEPKEAPTGPVAAEFPFFSSMVSHDWEALGYPSQKVARFWDTSRSGSRQGVDPPTFKPPSRRRTKHPP